VPYDSQVMDDNSWTVKRRMAEYAAVVVEANRRTLDPLVVELIIGYRPSPDLT